MTTFKNIATLTALTIGLTANAASAQQHLRDVAYVTEGALAVGIALEIADVCPDISSRKIRGLAYLNQLRNHALELGFTSEEIETFRKDKAEKRRLRVIGRERLAAMGAPEDDVAAHCAVGRAEIANGTTIGYLLNG